MTTERRFNMGAPVRIETRADGSRMLIGHAAVFYNPADPGTEYSLWDDVFERVAPGAFDRAIREADDARGLFNHNPDHLLGRVSAGTLALSVDAKGLRYEIKLPTEGVARTLPELVERKDLTGSSFSFRAQSVEWTEERRDGRRIEVRTLKEVELFDVGPVTFPAYDATTTGLRAAGGIAEIRAERDRMRRDLDAARLALLAVEEEELKG